MLPDIRKHLIYKYILYRLKKQCARCEAAERLSQEERETLCADVAKKVRKRTLIFGIIYFFATIPLWSYMIRYPDQNAFSRWFIDTLESVIPLTQSDWGIYPVYRRGAIYMIFIRLLPISLLILTPLLLWMLVTAEILLNRKLKSIAQ